MGITAVSGPYVSFGMTFTSTGGVQEYNEERALSVFDLGYGLLDPRPQLNYRPGNAVGTDVAAFQWGRAYHDWVPSSGSSLNIANSSMPAASAAVTLATASSANGTYSITFTSPEDGKSYTCLTCDSSLPPLIGFNSTSPSAAALNGTVTVWNPAVGAGRPVSITTSSSGDGGTFTVNGFDVYLRKVTEIIAANSTTATAYGLTGSSNSSGYTNTTKKAFKYIYTVTGTSTPVSTGVTIGFSSYFGFPFALYYCGLDVQTAILPSAYSSAAFPLQSSANTVLGSTVTATSTTPDTRGLWLSSAAANQTLRVQIMQLPTVGQLTGVLNGSATTLFGVTQYSNF